MSETSTFTAETARAALNAILESLEMDENALKLNEAKIGAGNDMLKVMQYVFPIVVQVEMDVIKRFGFTDNREGIIQFTQLIVALEKEDDLIADLHSQVRAHYLPPVTIASDVSL
ncbi:protein C10 [Cimex lectularius]|uniref:Protein C10 n=1 Tax=Cimex lectularius TaxID=79782 RepID=A0A8I6RPC5_CIMLE|nr:protein C10 [Cimex lectularius]